MSTAMLIVSLCACWMVGSAVVGLIVTMRASQLNR